MKKHLTTVAIFLLAGAVVNVAVAWGYALWGPIIDSGPRSDPFPRLAPDTSWPKPVPPDWPSPWYGSWGHGLCMSTGVFGAVIPPDQAVSDGRPRDYGLSLALYGFPFRSLEWEIRMLIAEPYARTDTIMAAVRAPDLISSNRSHGLIPLRPIWRGFAANTIFYATILWLLIPGSFALRRLIRQRRGLCPACGYDLRHGEHEACPECGVSA